MTFYKHENKQVRYTELGKCHANQIDGIWWAHPVGKLRGCLSGTVEAGSNQSQPHLLRVFDRMLFVDGS